MKNKLLFYCLLLSSSSFAQNMYDPSFGGDGIVTTGLATTGPEEAFAVAIQADGKIVVVGTANGHVAICRYNTDGSLDMTSQYNITNSTLESAKDVVIRPNGKILVCGYCNGLNERYFLRQYNPNGTIDQSFGTNSVVDIDYGDEWQTDCSLTLQPDEKVLITGEMETSNDRCFGTARFNIDGTIDATFGSNGRVYTDIFSQDKPQDILVQPDGKIVVLGNCFGPGATYVTGVVRYNSDGTLDSTFNDDGIFIDSTANGQNYVRSMKLLPDGKLLAGGYGYFSDSIGLWSKSIILRLNTNGFLDSTFNTDGIAIPNNYNTISDIAIANDGKIVSTGLGGGSGWYYHIATMRMNQDGIMDSTFGSNGVIITSLGDSDSGNGIAVQSDNKIIVAGTKNPVGGDFLAIRFLPELICDSLNEAIVTPPGPISACPMPQTTLHVSVVPPNPDLTIQWRKDGNNLNGANDTLLNIYLPGLYDAILINELCIIDTSNTVQVFYNPPAYTPSVIISNDTLFAVTDGGIYQYQWCLNTYSNIIPGATSNYFIPVLTGHYGVIITDTNGCVSTLVNWHYFVASSTNNLDQSSQWQVFMDNYILTLNLFETNLPAQMILYDAIGRVILEKTITSSSSTTDLSSLAEGVYLVSIRNEKNYGSWKIMVQ